MNQAVVEKRQLLAAVTAAELRRQLALSGMVRSLIVSVLVAVIAGLIATWVLGIDIGIPISRTQRDIYTVVTGSAFLGLALCIAHLGYATRCTMDGSVVTSLLMVPNRGRLLLARVLSSAITTAVASVAVSLVLSVVRVASDGATWFAVYRLAMVTLVSLAVVVLVGLLGFLAGTILRRGVAAVVTALGVIIVLPAVLSGVMLSVPQQWAKAVDIVASLMPGRLVTRALSLPTSSGETWNPTLIGLGGLVV